MESVTAQSGQTVFDIALQEMGSIAGVFDLLEANPELQLDLEVPAGTRVNKPTLVVNNLVADYFSRNVINPVSGMGEEVQLSEKDLIMVVQNLEYDLVNGDCEFNRVRLYNLRERLTVQINYTGLGDGDLSHDPALDWSQKVKMYIDQSLDGINFSHVPWSMVYLDPDVEIHTYNIIGLLTNYVRACVYLDAPSKGIIHQIIWKVL
jgi:hypothetical protein